MPETILVFLELVLKTQYINSSLNKEMQFFMYTYLLKEIRLSARTKFQWECKPIFAQYFLKMCGFRFTIMEVLLEVFEKRRVKTNQNHIFFTPEHLLVAAMVLMLAK